MNLSNSQIKRMLTGTLLGLGLLMSGQAHAAGKMVDVVSLLKSGADISNCVIISPADNRIEVHPGSCGDVIISPADNATGSNDGVIISPADNREQSSDSVIISPADNKGPFHLPHIIIGPVDNATGPVAGTVIISPADNCTTVPTGVIISPADNATNEPTGVIISPADNRVAMTVVTDMNGMSDIVVQGALQTAAFSTVSTLKAEAALALVDAGASPASIRLSGVEKAVAGLELSEDNVLLFAQASRIALSLKASGSCVSGDSLASALCSSLR